MWGLADEPTKISSLKNKGETWLEAEDLKSKEIAWDVTRFRIDPKNGKNGLSQTICP